MGLIAFIASSARLTCAHHSTSSVSLATGTGEATSRVGTSSISITVIGFSTLVNIWNAWSISGMHGQYLECMVNIWNAWSISGMHGQYLECMVNIWNAWSISGMHGQYLECMVNIWNVWSLSGMHAQRTLCKIIAF